MTDLDLFQSNPDGCGCASRASTATIVQAQAASDQGRRLKRRPDLRLRSRRAIVERIDARSAELQPGTWVLHKARVFSATKAPEEFETYRVSTNLVAEQVRGSSDVREAVSFWELPAAVAAAERAGLRTERYRLLYQLYLVQPLVLVTMVVIAAAFSLKVFRLGGVGKMVLGAVLAGFVLFLPPK
jgi:lipopolysaccharide export system permease protein